MSGLVVVWTRRHQWHPDPPDQQGRRKTLCGLVDVEATGTADDPANGPDCVRCDARAVGSPSWRHPVEES